jgi:CreA protein
MTVMTTRGGMMTQEIQVAPVATNTPFDYSQNLVISVGVSDLDKAIDWYGDVLGLELVYKLDQHGWCEMATATKHVTIGLGQTEELKPGSTTPTFGVMDIEAARKHLESKDVRFDGDTYEIEGMVKLCMFYDPDGNSYMLAESLDGRQRS